MKILLCIGLLSFSTLTFAQNKTYVLKEKKENANINYNLFGLFGDFEIYENKKDEKAFIPAKGNFTIYTFIAEFKGWSYDGTKKIFHDYLILKVVPKTNEIIDGYQYTMEWAEPPAVSDLYRVTKKRTRIEGRNEFE